MLLFEVDSIILSCVETLVDPVGQKNNVFNRKLKSKEVVLGGSDRTALVHLGMINIAKSNLTLMHQLNNGPHNGKFNVISSKRAKSARFCNCSTTQGAVSIFAGHALNVSLVFLGPTLGFM